MSKAKHKNPPGRVGRIQAHGEEETASFAVRATVSVRSIRGGDPLISKAHRAPSCHSVFVLPECTRAGCRDDIEFRENLV
jgi:hypothetical protein